MRYSVLSKRLSLGEVQRKCAQAGAVNIKIKPIVQQVYCDLSPDAAAKLAKEHGLKVNPVKSVRPIKPILVPNVMPVLGAGLNLYTTYNETRQYFSPALNGAGLTVALLDSGVRASHEALFGKVLLEENFTGTPTADDIYGHGTGVAYIIAGSYGEKSGVAPGAKIMSMKVLNNVGEGSDETVVDAIERVCELVQEAIDDGLLMTDDMYPNTINLSAGSEDDGDPDNPMRVACQAAVEEYGLQIIAAAGNFGPDASTILCPASDPLVVAVGGLETWNFEVWEFSSRGPTMEGIVKPDLVCWAEAIEVASHKGDNEYDVKSGTSFSTPILVGVDGLLWDLARRRYGENMRVTYYDWLPYAYAYCIKPPGIQVAKDNSYGYGIPALAPMVSRLMAPEISATTIVESAMPLMMLMAIMPMITSVGGT